MRLPNADESLSFLEKATIEKGIAYGRLW